MSENEKTKLDDVPRVVNGIEITQEMIRAGAGVLMEGDLLRPLLGPLSAEDYVERILAAGLALALRETIEDRG